MRLGQRPRGVDAERGAQGGRRTGDPPDRARRRGDVLVRGTVVTTAAYGMSTLLGLGRDLLLAGYFGANGETDAFLVAWTLPENAVPLLIDNAMALLMIPVFTRALRERDELGTAPTDPLDPVRALVAATLPKLTVALAVLAGLVAGLAPWLVAALFPGLANPGLAVAAMRTIAVSVVFIGIAGYFASALRAHLVYGPPAAINIAMNVGIVGLMIGLHQRIGVLAAVLGATVGSVLMVAVQLRAFRRHVGLPRRFGRGTQLSLGAIMPLALYIVIGQSLTFVERYVAAQLAPGTITHLSYVQKIGQQFSTVALILAVVTFPRLSRDIADGNMAGARRRAARDIQIIGALVMAATAYLVAFAPEVVRLLLQRGAFTAEDTAATAELLRIYVWGLLAQAVLNVVCRSVFSHRPSYRPAVAVCVGVLTTGVVANLGAPVWGAPAIAAGNAIGLTVTTLLVVCSRSSEVMPARVVGLALARLVPATAVSVAFALWLADRLRGLPTAASVLLGGLAVLLVYGATAALTRGLPVPRRRAPAGRGAPPAHPAPTGPPGPPASPTPDPTATSPSAPTGGGQRHVH